MSNRATATAGQGKVLVIAGTPPGTGHVGEIILRDLVMHLGQHRVRHVAINNPRYRWKAEPALDGMDLEFLSSDFVSAQRRGQGKWSAPGAHARHVMGFQREVSRLVGLVVAGARSAGVTKIFAVLNNALLMAVAHRVAKELQLPLYTLVWDPPEYILRQARFDRWSRTSLLREFQSSLAASARVAVVSETMREDYARWTKAPIQLLRHGIGTGEEAAGSNQRQAPPDEWVIGFAGSMYSSCAWGAFIKALDQAEWRVAGRPVRLKVMSAKVEAASKSRANIDYLGFRPSTEVQEILAGCHLTYMPQPFVSHLRDLCRYSFPTKLTNYLATGRPVFIHAPPEGALSAFFAENRIGALASSLEPKLIIETLEALLASPTAYAEACSQVRSANRQHFTSAAFHRAIDGLLGEAFGVPEQVVGEVPA